MSSRTAIISCPSCHWNIRMRVMGLRPRNKKIDYRKVDPLLGKNIDRVVAERFGICSATVRNRRIALGIPPLRRHPGSMSSKRGLFVNLRKSGMTIQAIAKMYGVSKQRIGQVLIRG